MMQPRYSSTISEDSSINLGQGCYGVATGFFSFFFVNGEIVLLFANRFNVHTAYPLSADMT